MWASVLTAVLVITALSLIAGLALSYASRKLPADPNSLVDDVNDLLPQTQCGQCGYPGCRPYAAAIVQDGAAINLCPPGGAETIERLAELLGREPESLAASEGTSTSGGLAIIDEALCIGCTYCREVCPVDAIVGAHHYMHTVLAAECTGCELCVPRCPVDCIRMERAA